MSCPGGCGKSIFGETKAVMQGTFNYVFENETVKAIAEPRIKICKGCPYVRELVKVQGKPVLQCTKCKCLVELKTRVETEICPIGNW